MAYKIPDPYKYIKSLTITEWYREWSPVGFVKYCGKPLIVMSADSPEIAPGTKVRLRFPIYAYFNLPSASWPEMYWGKFEFVYQPRSVFEGEAQRSIGAKVRVVTDMAPVTAVVKVNVKRVGTPPTNITVTYDGTLIGEKTVNSPGIYEIGRVELPPGTYLIRAAAVDSAGRTATAEKYFTS